MTVADTERSPRWDHATRSRPGHVSSSAMLAGAVLVGVALRFATLRLQSFWVDEAYTRAIVAHGLGHALSTIPRTESTPPLYYVLLWFWSRVFGIGEAGLRSFSAVCGTLTIPLLYVLGRRLFSERVGLIAAVLAAVNPLLVWYSQEARAYALLVLLSALSLLMLLRACERPGAGRLAVWGVVSALALATHYFAALVVGPEAAWLLVVLLRRREWSPARSAAAYLPVVLAAAALLPLLIHQDDGRAGFLSTSGSLPRRLAQLAKQHTLGFDAPHAVPLSAIALALVALAVAWLALRGEPEAKRAAALPLGIAVVGVALAVLPALLGADEIDSRNLLELWPVEALVVALGFAACGPLGSLGVAALAAVSLAATIGIDTNPLFQRSDWRGAAHALGRAPGLRAIVTPGQGAVALTPYLSGVAAYPAGGAPVAEVDVIGLDYRPPGASHNIVPVRPHTAPPLPGFRLMARRETDSYTVLRYAAAAPRVETPDALLSLALRSGYTLVLQAPRHGG